MHWIAPSEKDTDNGAFVSSVSALDEERAGVRCSTSATEPAVTTPHIAETERPAARPEGLFLRFAALHSRETLNKAMFSIFPDC